MLTLLEALLSCAATSPTLLIVCVWLCLFLRSALAQRIGLSLGLDVNRDGQIGCLDVVKYLERTPVGQACRLESVHAFFTRQLAGRFDSDHSLYAVSLRVRRVERVLSEKHGYALLQDELDA